MIGRLVIRIGLCLAGLWIGVSVTSSAHAADSVLPPSRAVKLPSGGLNSAGFNVDLVLGDLTSAGYLPVQITITFQTITTSDRSLNFQFDCTGSNIIPTRNGMIVDVPLTIPQGTTTVTATRYLPKWTAGQSVSVTLWEQGRSLDGYEAIFDQRTVFGRSGYSQVFALEESLNWVYLHWNENITSSLIPHIQGLMTVSVFGADSSPVTEVALRATWTAVQKGPQLLVMPVTETPHDWRGYQRYDVVVVPKRSLSKLREDADAFEALRQWVLTGGTVVTYNNESFQSAMDAFRFGQAEPLSEQGAGPWLSPRMLGRVQNDVQQLRNRIKALRDYIDRMKLGQGVLDPNAPADLNQIEQEMTFGSDEATVAREIAFTQEQLRQIDFTVDNVRRQWPTQITSTSAGAGRLIVVPRSEDYESPTLLHWKAIAQFVDYRASPTVRRGVDPLLGSRRFSAWLIPGVAQPPVYTFIGLLTVFVILVGPVAYIQSARIGRTYLMFIIAPLLAITTTVSMFAYGIFSDGFGIKVRTRQLTWVDGASGDAGEWVRSTYFAGVRPGGGLQYAGNAEVFGFPESTGLSLQESSQMPAATLGRVTVEPQIQRLDPSFLPSRQQRQFVSIAPRPQIGYLSLTPDEKRINAPTIHNGFGFALREAVVRDQDGVFWQVRDLAAGQDRRCESLTIKESSKVLGRILNEYRPVVEQQQTSRRNSRYGNRIYDVISYFNRRAGARNEVLEGVFEQWLQLHLQTAGEIPRGQFVATADPSTDVIAVQQCEVVDSVRYLFGTLR